MSGIKPPMAAGNIRIKVESKSQPQMNADKRGS